jgi:glycosyltransferase involved in cell wall biosynthesis
MYTVGITVLIDTYNYGHFIDQALDSVLSQGLPPEKLEVIVVDDGSTDDTAERVSKYGSRVKYLRKQNGGQASAFNLGFAHARGEVIALLDADDYFLPGKLRRLLETFAAHPEVGMVYHRFPRLFSDTIAPAEGFEPISGFLPDDPQALSRYRSHPTSSLAVKTTILQQILPLPESMRISADAFLDLAAVLLTPVCALSEDLAVYRIHKGNLFAGYFQATDVQAARRLVVCMDIVQRELRLWVRKNRDRIGKIDTDRLLDGLMFLPFEQLYQFQSPSRMQYFSFLLRKNHAFSLIEPRWYSVLKYALASSALVVSYRQYRALHAWCAKTLNALRPRGS